MSNTYGGWHPQDSSPGQPPYGQPPHGQPHGQQQPYGQQPQQDPYGQVPQSGQAGQPLDPYGPRDPYGRPANPYGRPDYQPPQYPHGGFQQQAAPPQQPLALRPVEAEPEPRPDDAPPTIGRAWGWAWGAFGASWGTWVLMSLALGAAQIAVVLLFSPSTLDGLMNSTDQAALDAAQAAGQTLEAKALGAAGTAITFLLQALLYAGALAATRTRTVRIRDFFFLRGFGGLLAYALLAGVIGFVSAAVPVVGGLIQAVCTLLLLPVPFLLLRRVGFGRALGGGVGLVLSHLGTALGVFGIFAGLAIASIFTCGIGLVVVAPVMLLVGAYLVQRWTGETVRS
ncbi:hypothetical protein GCM10010413_47790 [Promicromonospora sukumoe]|uniref:Putative membrane protein n=1 Tax=Promicromonospora sukumoe TaxID=88382 RepID=A0A7W3PFF4_9MICO|nr:hypothetical protein [Promicromonospora sukumoe]MBA8809534.1 putative membrane protein [Promicromonospora sukumoe]